MKKLLIVLMLTFGIYASFCFADNSTPDFRNVNWGMTKNQVLKSESLKLVSQLGNSLIYKTEISNKDCNLHYIFSDDKLYGAAYYFNVTHANENDYINDYEDLKQLLIKKYDAPKETDAIWKNNLYRNNQSQWGMAISVGHLVYYSKWETKKTDVSLVLQGENFEIKLIIVYKSKEYGGQATSKKENKELQNL